MGLWHSSDTPVYQLKINTLTSSKTRFNAAGCLKIFTDTVSGAKAERKGLEEALDYVREGIPSLSGDLTDLAAPSRTSSNASQSCTAETSALRV